MNSGIRIAVDLDETIAAFSTALLRLIEEEKGTLTQEVREGWWKLWNTDTFEGRLMNRAYFDSNFWRTLPLECSEYEMKRLATIANDSPHDVFFFTYRPTRCYDVTLKWLQYYGIKNPMLLCGAEDKGDLCRGLAIKHHLDDRYFIAYGVKQRSPMTTSWLLTQPHNIEHRVEDKGLIRVHSILDWLNEIYI